jgi:hypothetical protein
VPNEGRANVNVTGPAGTRWAAERIGT